MFADTTCFYTKDKQWIQIPDLAGMTIKPQLMCFRHGRTFYTNNFELHRVGKRRLYLIRTPYDINIRINRQHRVICSRGQVKGRAMVPADELYLFMSGKIIKTHPLCFKCIGMREAWNLKLHKHTMLVAKDEGSRWQAAYDVGLIVGDIRGSDFRSKDVTPLPRY